MARRRHVEEHENHERWLVSYADFITLLFAFFVVMYSISSINEGKYKILSDSLDGIFSQPDRSIMPIPIGEERPRSELSAPADVQSDPARDNDDDPLGSIMRSMEQAFGDLIAAGQITIRGDESWLEIEMSSSLLFPSGDAIPNDGAFVLIDTVAEILAPYKNPVRVEGFTDNLPISTAQYPTNWELSAARAGSVVRMLAAQGVSPTRLAAVGYGEYQPIAGNDTPEDRARNRRVVLVISRNLDVRQSVAGVESQRRPIVRPQGQGGTQPAQPAAVQVSNQGAVNSSTVVP